MDKTTLEAVHAYLDSINGADADNEWSKGYDGAINTALDWVEEQLKEAK